MLFVLVVFKQGGEAPGAVITGALAIAERAGVFALIERHRDSESGLAVVQLSQAIGGKLEGRTNRRRPRNRGMRIRYNTCCFLRHSDVSCKQANGIDAALDWPRQRIDRG
jgi:hypothetical protein